MTPSALDRDDLKRSFASLGLRPGDLVMLHSSYRSLGPVAGGPLAVVAGLMDVLGDTGGILVFGSWQHSTYDRFVDGPGLTDQERQHWPAFVGKASPVRPNYAGVIGSAIADLPESGRSANPDRSLIALGQGALALIEDHGLDHGFGPVSPLARFVEEGGRSLLLGAPLSTVTVTHLAEYLAEIGGKRSVAYEVPSMEAGQKVWHPVEQMDRDAFVPAMIGREHDHIAEIAQDYVKRRQEPEQSIGNARCLLLDAQAYVTYACRWMERAFEGVTSTER